MSCYYIPWGHDLLKKGFLNIYPESSVDYPPLYLYFLYLTAKLEKFFWPDSQVSCWPLPNLSSEDRLVGLLYKTPLIIADLALALLIYKLLEMLVVKKRRLVFIFFLLNPALIYISSVWGQTDGLLLTFLLSATFFLLKNSYFLSFLFLWLAFFLKTQAVFFLPFYFFYFLKFRKKRELIFKVGLSLILGLVIIFPFLLKMPVFWLPQYYFSRAKAWQITSVWATTFIGLLFGNYQADGISIGNLGFSPFFFSAFLLLGFVSISSFWLLFLVKKKDFFKPKFLIKLLFASVFLFFYFSSRMHSRFLIYPTVLSFLVFRGKRLAIPLGLSLIAFLQMVFHFDIQLTSFFNTAWLKTVIAPSVVFYFLNCLTLMLAGIIFLNLLRRRD